MKCNMNVLQLSSNGTLLEALFMPLSNPPHSKTELFLFLPSRHLHSEITSEEMTRNPDFCTDFSFSRLRS